MKIKEIYGTTDGIFHDLKQVNETEFIQLFNDEDTNILDVMFISKAASKTISPIVESYIESDGTIASDSRVIIAKTIWAMYGYQWRKAYEALMTDYNAMDASNYTLVTTEEITGNNSSTDTNKGVKAVYGFDSVDCVNDNEDDTTSTSKGTNSSSRKTTVSKSGKDGGYTYGTLLDNALKAAKNSFNSIAVSNVVNFTTTDIYD